MIGYLEAYAAAFGAPIRPRQDVTAVRAASGGFVVETPTGPLLADAVVVASGAFGRPRIPAVAERLPPGIRSIHTDDYRNPAELPPGGVLVVGAGQGGLQIADELVKTGRPVWVAVGRHGWVPRKVYGRDQMYWRWENGDFRSVVAGPGATTASTRSPRWRAGGPTISTSGPSSTTASGWSATSRRSTAPRSRSRPTSTGSSRPATTTPGPSSAGCATSLEGVAKRSRARARQPLARRRDARDRDRARPRPGRDHERRLGDGLPTRLRLADGRRSARRRRGADFQVRGVSPVDGLYFVGIHRMYEAAAGTVLGCGWVAEYVADRIAGRGTAGGR